MNKQSRTRKLKSQRIDNDQSKSSININVPDKDDGSKCIDLENLTIK